MESHMAKEKKDSGKTIVLVSGGMDSCVTAAIAAERGGPLALLHVNYGQRTEARELASFKRLADFYAVKERLIADVRYLAAIGGSALTDAGIKIPTVAERTAGVQPTYVPFRNTHLIAIAVSWAEVIGATKIMIGIVEEDAAGYPDCRRSYLAAMNEVVRLGTRPETEIEVEAPLVGMTKTEIVRRGAELGAPFALTWSCYRQEDVPCGDCLSCELRRKAFAEAGVEDPIRK